MGTNFYIGGIGQDKTNEIEKMIHIGKRSAAGRYCWDCKKTLCKSGEEFIHYSNNYFNWYNECPTCGKKAIGETLDISAAGRELGFNKSKPHEKHGVQSCSSFSWAIRKNIIESWFATDNSLKIYDEYGEEYTWEEFEEMLTECPINYYNLLGQEFS